MFLQKRDQNVINKLDDYIIDVSIPKFLYVLQLTPSKVAIQCYGIALCISLFQVFHLHEWIILIASICLICQISTFAPREDFSRLHGKPIRWTMLFCAVYFLINLIIISSVDMDNILSFLFMMFYAFAEFVICCKQPPKKKSKFLTVIKMA